MGDRWSVVPPPLRTSVGMWAQWLFAPLEHHAPGRPSYVLWRSLL
jgi:hypothetical protein